MFKIDGRRIKFIKWGIAAKYYGIIGKTLRLRKHLDKSVEYLDKRWEMMITNLRKGPN